MFISADTRQGGIVPSTRETNTFKIQAQLKDLGIVLPQANVSNVPPLILNQPHSRPVSQLNIQHNQPLIATATRPFRPPRIKTQPQHNDVRTTDSGTQVLLLYPKSGNLNNTHFPDIVGQSDIHRHGLAPPANTGQGHINYHSSHVHLPGEDGNNSTRPVIHRVRQGEHHHSHANHHSTHVDLPGVHGNNSTRPIIHRTTHSEHGHRSGLTGTAQPDHRHVKYHSTHVDLPGEHGNNSTRPIIHRIPQGGQGHGGHRHGHPHSHPTNHHETHVDLPGEHGNLSPHAVIHRVGSAHRHVNQPVQAMRPADQSGPVIHGLGHDISRNVASLSAPYSVSDGTLGNRPVPGTGGTVQSAHYINVPTETAETVSTQHQHQPVVQAQTSQLGILPSYVEGGLPMPSEFATTPTSPTMIPPMPDGMAVPYMGEAGVPFGLGGGPIAPFHMPFRPLRPFGPLAHLPPFLRRRIRFRRRMRRRMRRLRRLNFMRQHGLIGPFEPHVGLPVPMFPML